MFKENSDSCKKGTIYEALKQLENSIFHLVKATMMYTRHQLISVGNYCSDRGSHEVCMREAPLQFPPITHKWSQGTLEADTTVSSCLQGHQCTQHRTNDNFRAIKTTHNALKTLRTFKMTARLSCCAFYLHSQTLWTHAAGSKMSVKRENVSITLIKRKLKKNPNRWWTLKINATKKKLGD